MLAQKKNKTAIWIIIAVLFLMVDRGFKSLAVTGFWDEPSFLIKDFFSLHFFKNYYIAFSIPWLSGNTLNVLILFIIAGLFYYLVFLCKKQESYSKIVLTVFLILGAASNFFDRIKLGYVVDYFDLRYFTVFNIADIMILIGAGGLIWMNIKK